MKNQTTDRLTVSGRLQTRFAELTQQVENRELPRMDGGDQIGKLIVANLEALPQRTAEESQLLFEAQRARARCYQESSGATALEAAESLIAARRTLVELGNDSRLMVSLLDLSQAIFTDLVEIGSKHNAWLCLGISISCLRASPEHKELIPDVLQQFAVFSRDMIEDGREPALLGVILRHCDWARQTAPDCFTELINLIPLLLEKSTADLPWEDVRRAYLYARHLSLGFNIETLEAICRKMIATSKADTETRVVYQDYLSEAGKQCTALEDEFCELAYVNPSTDLEFDAQLDSLNGLLAEHFPESGWVWRNRALLSRRRGDRAAALVYLARAMSIDGEPPELLGLMAPLLAGLGFTQSAFQFARFATKETRERFKLSVLGLLAAEPTTSRGCDRLQHRLEQSLLLEDLPVEFRSLISKRRAELLYRCGNYDLARGLYMEIFRDDLSNEMAAVRLAEISMIDGDIRRIGHYLQASFSKRVEPYVEYIKSRLAELEGNIEVARRHNTAALEMIDEAQMAGRHEKMKTLSMLEDRIRAVFGESHVHCSLLAVLQAETHAPPHRDLLDLEARLEKRAVELGIASGDVESTQMLISDLVERDAVDLSMFESGARVSLENDRVDEALELLNKAVEAGHGNHPGIRLLRAKAWMRSGDHDAARAFFEEELARHPSAESRLYLAMIDCENGDESAALEHLASIREEDGGSRSVRHQIHWLKGVLLERVGELKKAHQTYLEAADLRGFDSPAAERAGIIGLYLAFDGHGSLKDPQAAEEALSMLRDARDSDSICRATLARAARTADVDQAVEELERGLTRVNPDDEMRLKRARLALLVANERFAAALEEAHSMTAMMSENEHRPHADLLAALAMRSALAEISTDGALDSRAVQAFLEVQFDDAGAAIQDVLRFAAREGEEPDLDSQNSAAVVLAAAVAGGQRHKDGKLLAAVLSDGAQGIASAEAKHMLISLQEGSARDILDAVDSFDAAGLSLPWDREDLLRIVIAKATAEDDHDTFCMAAERSPGCFPNHEKYWRLVGMLRESEVDATRVLSLFSDLAARMAAGSRDEMMQEIQARVTDLRETPSEAWASGRLRVAGKRSKTHEEAARQFWEQKRSKGEDSDGEAIHHLALMALARAHEAEMTGVESATIWQEVHQLWGELVASDRFWFKIVERMGGAASMDVVSRLREKVAGWLLQAQVALAKRRRFAGDLSRAVEHGRLVANSPLVKSCDIRFVQDLLFDALSGGLEKHLHKRHFDEALSCIDHVIVVDPDNPLARREMVRVAGMAIEQNLAVAQSLKHPDESMIHEICSLLRPILVTAERSISELAEERVTDPEIAHALVNGLRGLAFVAVHRDHDQAGAVALIERAIAISEDCGLDDTILRKVRSEIGLELVEETIAKAPTASQKLQPGTQDLFAEALSEVDRLIELDAGNVKVIAQKARLLLAANRDDEAEVLARNLFADAQKKGAPTLVREAVELMHQVRSEREKLRYQSKMEMVDRLCADDNWRAALDMFKEAVVGRENEPEHLLKHVDILIGLRKLDRAEVLAESLEDCELLENEWQIRRARLASLRYYAEEGGDLQSASELVERGKYVEAIAIIDELLQRDSKNGPLQFLAASCHRALGREERADAHAVAAVRCARGREEDWVRTLIDEERMA